MIYKKFVILSKIVTMNIAVSKIELAKQILSINDKSIIRQVKALLEVQKDDWYDELPEYVKQSVEISEKQLANGEGIPHKEVMKKYKSQYMSTKKQINKRING